MTYKTIVIDYTPKAKKMAVAIEQATNEKARDGWEIVTSFTSNSDKAILVFRVPEDIPYEETTQKGTAQEAVVQEKAAEAVSEAE